MILLFFFSFVNIEKNFFRLLGAKDLPDVRCHQSSSSEKGLERQVAATQKQKKVLKIPLKKRQAFTCRFSDYVLLIYNDYIVLVAVVYLDKYLVVNLDIEGLTYSDFILYLVIDVNLRAVCGISSVPGHVIKS